MTTIKQKTDNQLTAQILEQIDKAKEQGKTVKEMAKELKREQVLQMIFKSLNDKA